eukprot:g675.t1
MKGAKLANLGGRKAPDTCASALAKRPQSLGRVRGGFGSVFGPQGKAAARALFCTKRNALQWLFALVFVLAAGVTSTLAKEWDCSATEGTFQLSTDCTMSDEVAVSGDLAVTGNETVYSTLTAATGKRHFKITSGAHTLRLKWLNLTGGSATGSIMVVVVLYIYRMVRGYPRISYLQFQPLLCCTLYGIVHAQKQPFAGNTVPGWFLP